MTLLANRYKLECSLGEGGEGQVWAAHDQWRQGHPVAIKQLNPSSSSSLTREFASLKRLKHPHIVEALDLIYVDSVPYLVQERVFGISLSQWSETNSPEALLELVSPIAHALAHLHARGWVHFDPTAANILVDDQSGRAYLIDLGLVQPIGSEVIGGTPGYIAPELYEGHQVTDKVDAYTLAKSVRELVESSEAPFAQNEDLKSLLESACCSDPYQRPSAYRLAKGFIELSGSGADDFLYRPLTRREKNFVRNLPGGVMSRPRRLFLVVPPAMASQLFRNIAWNNSSSVVFGFSRFQGNPKILFVKCWPKPCLSPRSTVPGWLKTEERSVHW